MGWREHRSPRWKKLRRIIKDRDGHRCKICGKAGRLEVDHVKSVSRGGAFWDPENLQSLCRKCHIEKTRGENCKPNPRRDAWLKFRDELV